MDEELGLFSGRFEHHSFLQEEARMFPEVLKTVDHADLNRMGDRMSRRLDRLRHSLLVRLHLHLKRAIMRLL